MALMKSLVKNEMQLFRCMAVCKSRLYNFNSPVAPCTQQVITPRFISIDQVKCSKPSQFNKEKQKFQTYVVTRYVDYVQRYTKLFEQKFPTAMHIYKVFIVGIKDFYKDLKTYISLRLKVTGSNDFSNITRKDIELYHKMPTDMFKVAPVLILSAIPFGNYFIFPLAYLKPRTLLSSHFWSLQQRAEFSLLDLKERLRHNKPVFRALQTKLDSITDSEMKEKWGKVLALLGSGVHPKPEEIADCKELFNKHPYSLNDISYGHAGHLLNMHGLMKGLFRKRKLRYHAYILHELDKAILREGGVGSMNIESLRTACNMRGLNSSHLSKQDMMSWLTEWLEISQRIDRDTYSLLLHCPILLAYNHSQNWMLIY